MRPKQKREGNLQAIIPDAHGVAVLLLTAVALFLFTRDRLPLETSSLIILIVLVAGFQIFPYSKNLESRDQYDQDNQAGVFAQRRTFATGA